MLNPTVQKMLNFKGKELADIQASGLKIFRGISVDERNMLQWHGLIVPVSVTIPSGVELYYHQIYDYFKDKEPYNKGAFKIQIDFPAEYPFKPPKITFLTKIYHPNIDEKGQVCLPIISPENWKPATKTDQVIQALVALVHDPEPDHPLRGELGEEYVKDKKKFMKNAADFAIKYAEKRPLD